MKKIITSLAIAFCLNTNAQIATKDFGTDSISGLNKKLIVFGLNINDDMQRIEVLYKICLITPNGKQIEQSRSIYYFDNSTANKNYDALEASAIGLAIKADISNDMLKIKSINTLETDLQQK